MKKILLTAIMLSAIVFTVFAQNGVIRELSGDVALKPAGASSFTAAKTGDEVARDTVVSTGFKSAVVIAVGSSTITVRPLTRLSLAEIQSASGAENVNVNLHAGRVRVDVKPPEGTRANLRVQSTNASASVRGTSFEFDTLNLTVSEGSVFFSGSSGAPAAVVRSGETSFVAADGNTANPADVSAAALFPSVPGGFENNDTLLPSSASSASSTPTTGEITVTPNFPD